MFHKKLLVSFFSGVVLALMSVVASAGIATGVLGYYDCNDYYYQAYNRIATGSTFAIATTSVESQNSSINFPTGYVGIQACVYNADTKKAVSKDHFRYNSSSKNFFSCSSPTYYASSGTYFSKGITRAYHPIDPSSTNYPYHQFGIPASPYQAIRFTN